MQEREQFLKTFFQTSLDQAGLPESTTRTSIRQRELDHSMRQIQADYMAGTLSASEVLLAGAAQFDNVR